VFSVVLTLLTFLLAGRAVAVEIGYGAWLAIVPAVVIVQLVPILPAGCLGPGSDCAD
jgi:hypothetical protein